MSGVRKCHTSGWDGGLYPKSNGNDGKYLRGLLLLPAQAWTLLTSERKTRRKHSVMKPRKQAVHTYS